MEEENTSIRINFVQLLDCYTCIDYRGTDRSKAVLLLWFLTVLAVCVYTLVHLLC